MRNFVTSAIAVATALFMGISAREAQAVDITVEDVIGTWSNVTGTPVNLSQNPTGNQIFFGGDQGNGQSSYLFVGSSPPDHTFAVGSGQFDLGTFTHINKTIDLGSSITGATLNLSITFNFGGPDHFTRLRSFVFTHNETDNNCLGLNCADDIVGVAPNGNPTLSETFNLSGIDYVFSFTGFLVSGSPFQDVEFRSPEGGTNSAVLLGSFAAVQNVPGPIVGAGLPGLIVASGGFFAWARRRRKVTEI